MTTIKIPGSVRKEIARRMEERPVAEMTKEDRDEILSSIPVEFQTEAEVYLNDLAGREAKDRSDYLLRAAERILKEDSSGRFNKPILTFEEAADLLSLSHKRFKNLVSEEQVRIGRVPDFVINADGKIQRRILRDKLLEWVKGRNQKKHRKILRVK